MHWQNSNHRQSTNCINLLIHNKCAKLFLVTASEMWELFSRLYWCKLYLWVSNCQFDKTRNLKTSSQALDTHYPQFFVFYRLGLTRGLIFSTLDAISWKTSTFVIPREKTDWTSRAYNFRLLLENKYNKT